MEDQEVTSIMQSVVVKGAEFLKCHSGKSIVMTSHGVVATKWHVLSPVGANIYLSCHHDFR